MNGAKISVIIPTHKRHRMLKEAIDSCLSQSVLPHEIVIVDDANCVHTQKLIIQFQRSNSNIKYIKNDIFPGAPTSRNLGAQNSSGDYLAFLDDDDRLTPSYIEIISKKIHDDQPNVIVNWLQDFYPDKTVKKRFEFPIHFDFYKDFDGVNPGFGGSNICYRRNVFFDVGMFDSKLIKSQDLDLMIQTIRCGYHISVIDQNISQARVHNEKRISEGIRGRRDHFNNYLYFYAKNKKMLNLKSKIFTTVLIANCVEGNDFNLKEKIIYKSLSCIIFFPAAFLLKRKSLFKIYRLRDILLKIGVSKTSIFFIPLPKRKKKI